MFRRRTTKSSNSQTVIKAMLKLLKNMQEQGKTIIVVSHDPFFEEIADNIIDLSNDVSR